MSGYWPFRMNPLTIALTLAVSAFAGLTSDAAAATLPKDPCALLEPAEIQTLAPNDKIGSGLPDTSGIPMAVGCAYTWGTRTKEWGQTTLSITVTDASQVWPAGLSSDDIKQRVLVEIRTDGPHASEIAGIGDGAVFTTDDKAHDAMAKAYFVKAKGILLMVSFHGGSAFSQRDKIIALLKTAGGRL